MIRRTILVSLLVLANPWLFEVVEAQKGQHSCSRIGAINGTKQNQRNETCGIVVNYTNIEVCDSGTWREICDGDFTQQDAQVICRQLGFSAIGATFGRADQIIGAHPSTFSPICNGQEPNISLCANESRSAEQCEIPKIFVTCFTERDPVSVPGIMCNMSSASSTPTTVSELPTTTSLASPSHARTSVDSTDSTNGGTDSSNPGTNVGAPRSGEQDPLGTTYTTIIIVLVCIIAALFLFMAVTFAVIKYKCKYSDTASVHHKKRDPVDVNESVLYSEVMDVPMEQSQQESSPVYETIVAKFEDTARVLATDTRPIDFKENIAYEANPMDLKENIAYEARLNPVDLQENIAYEARLNPVDLQENMAYEASKMITTEANDAYDEVASILQSTVD